MEEPCHSKFLENQQRKYKSRRLQEAFIFLKAISAKPGETEENISYGSSINFIDTKQKLKTGGVIIQSIEEDDKPQDDSAFLLLNRNGSTKRPHLIHSASVTTAVNVGDEFKHGREVDQSMYYRDGLCPKVLRSKSTVETTKDLQMCQFIRVSNPNHFEKLERKLSNRRIVFMTHHQVPLHLTSVIPYHRRIVNEKRTSSSATQQYTTMNNNRGDFIENIDFSSDGKKEVSYSHLLVPESWKRRASANLEEDDLATLDHESIVLDDPELTSGKHRTVLNLPSFMTSIISYAKPSEVKKDINERFKEKFPQVTITLTKLRSIKAELLQISVKMSLDPAVLASCYFYFEKVTLKTKITKQNRKCIAGACLLLSIKFFDDFHSKNIHLFIEAITDQFRLTHKDLLSCELQVLILLEFALLTKLHNVYVNYKRVESVLIKSS